MSQVPDEYECPFSLGAPALDHEDILVADGASWHVLSATKTTGKAARWETDQAAH